MRARASRTAEVVCLLRALGPDDPFARTLLSPASAALGRLWQAAARGGVPVDTLTLGLRPLILNRHAWIDADLELALAEGAAQVVLLGAGLDARPWRFAERLGDRPVFLVDHPGTAALRAARSAGVRARAAADLRRVDVDFARADFGVALLRAGFEPRRPAVVVWEGVSMYLPQHVATAALDRLAELLSPGSRLTMDFWRPSGPGLRAWVRGVVGLSRVALAASGERVHFGLPSEAIPAYLSDRGFEAEAVRVPETGPWPGVSVVRARRLDRATSGA